MIIVTMSYVELFDSKNPKLFIAALGYIIKQVCILFIINNQNYLFSSFYMPLHEGRDHNLIECLIINVPHLCM